MIRHGRRTDVAEPCLGSRVNDVRETAQNGSEDGLSGHVSDTRRRGVGEDGVFVIVSEGSDGRLDRAERKRGDARVSESCKQVMLRRRSTICSDVTLCMNVWLWICGVIKDSRRQQCCLYLTDTLCVRDSIRILALVRLFVPLLVS